MIFFLKNNSLTKYIILCGEFNLKTWKLLYSKIVITLCNIAFKDKRSMKVKCNLSALVTNLHFSIMSKHLFSKTSLSTIDTWMLSPFYFFLSFFLWYCYFVSIAWPVMQITIFIMVFDIRLYIKTIFFGRIFSHTVWNNSFHFNTLLKLYGI